MKNTTINYENLRELNAPFFEEYRSVFDKVLESGWYILGDEVRNFEEQFALYNKIEYAVGVASGLDAITLSLASFDFEKGDEVIVPSNTYIATVLSVLQNGLTPVFVEPSLETYNIDPKKIEEKITSKTKAILVVHLYGKCCDMAPITNLCSKHGLRLVEDCAQAHGASVEDKLAGTFGDFGAFSFYPTKNLGALGDGGAIICSNQELYLKVRKLRNYGSETKYYNDVIGYNSRLDELQAAFLSIKLKYLNKINAHKRELASLYFDSLKSDFVLPVRDSKYWDVYHIFNVRHEKRDVLREYLLKNSIKTEIHYPVPPHQQKALHGVLREDSFPISEEVHKTTLSLPISFCHSKEEIYQVIEVMNKF